MNRTEDEDMVIEDMFFDLEVAVVLRRSRTTQKAELTVYESVSDLWVQLARVYDRQGNILGTRGVHFDVIPPSSDLYDRNYGLIVAIQDTDSISGDSLLLLEDY